MNLPQTYSRRKRERAQAGSTKVFREFLFGRKLLHQLWLLLNEIRTKVYARDRDLFDELNRYVRAELGVISIANGKDVNNRFYQWWVDESSPTAELQDLKLDCLEIAYTTAISWAGRDARHINEAAQKRAVIEGLVAQINGRMMEDSFGFQLERGQIVEAANEFLHREVVEPVLGVLADVAFASVDQEFRDALDEFKQGNYDDCIADCGNSFESALKVIAGQRGWTTKPTDRAAQLLTAAEQNGLFPPYMQSQLSALKQLLTGIPTIRNNEGGHGAGETPRQVDKHLASYQLHQTAAAIIFLVECSKR